MGAKACLSGSLFAKSLFSKSLFSVSLLGGAGMVVAALVAAPAPAKAQALGQLSCRALWVQRNAVYADAGYCFQTPDAIATFGRNCFPPYGKLTPRQQNRVNEIRSWEARKGCN